MTGPAKDTGSVSDRTIARLTAGESTGGAACAVPVEAVEPGDRGALGVPPAPAVNRGVPS